MKCQHNLIIQPNIVAQVSPSSQPSPIKGEGVSLLSLGRERIVRFLNLYNTGLRPCGEVRVFFRP